MQGSSYIRLFFIAGFVLFVIHFASVGGVSATETVDRIVAIVNDDIIRLKELDAAFKPVAQEVYSKNYSQSKEEKILFEKRIEVLNQLIDETLIDQVIQKKGISVSTAEIDNAIEQIKSRNYYTDEDLRGYLRMNGMDMETYRNKIRKQILRSKLMNREVKSSIVITDSEIRDYYESHTEKYKGESKYHLKNIFIPYAEDASTPSKSQGRKRIDDAMAELNNGQAFESVAKKYSESENASEGGELGTFALNDLQEDLQPVIKNLSPGETSSIIETEKGFQIFYLQEIEKAPDKPLDAVADDIRKVLYEQAVNEKFDEWLESFRKDAHIKITR